MKFITKKSIILPIRDKDARKGDNGKVLAVAGSEKYPGAAALSALAAFRAGVDWVTVACPEKVAWAINAYAPDLVTIKLPGKIIAEHHVLPILKSAQRHTLVILGNGVGLDTKTKKAIISLNKKIHLPKVIDADALKVIRLQDCRESILTPHLGEMGLLLSNSGINNNAIKKIMYEKDAEKRAQLIFSAIKKMEKRGKKDFFRQGNVILLKGHIATILSRKGVFFCRIGLNMTKAGTGDVLAGLAAGFYAQSHDALQSAVNASYFGKVISKILHTKKKGFTFLASDMVEEIERAKKHF